jgi:hypothetical protein
MNRFTEEKATSILALVAELKRKQAIVNEMLLEIEQHQIQIIANLWKEIEGWEPLNDEMAVCYYPDSDYACYVWFTEKWSDRYRFKETPNSINRNSNYFSQPVVPVKGSEFLILPLLIFERLNKTLNIDIENKFRANNF